MLLRSLRLFCLVMAWLLLGSFRMPADEARPETLLYDVRAAFVTARPEVSHNLLSATDRLVASAIRATFRQQALPRAVLTIRIEDTVYLPLLFGGRFRAQVTVEAVSVVTGEKVAVGSFAVSAFALDATHADARLAERIAERVVQDFRLQDTVPSTLATALFP
ncbi:hypothetical protein SAMN05880590_10796 [Rhizobium sp. RU35A]|uniref:DUF4410 domain-containing protein n=1 Tax=Rhizobium straminoryzae TaxID=1387186 RepID=A0A549SQ38_9HYPH|nr:MULTISPECIES: hypothetical protein [Rhizobium]TRL31724.1 hypothetical protein FNA46_24260 [Rhizobium straminoryzae]SIQ77090.1 hypothetical protein SAMN05880590_10796 [Rhizobium sp. RU35A]